MNQSECSDVCSGWLLSSFYVQCADRKAGMKKKKEICSKPCTTNGRTDARTVVVTTQSARTAPSAVCPCESGCHLLFFLKATCQPHRDLVFFYTMPQLTPFCSSSPLSLLNPIYNGTWTHHMLLASSVQLKRKLFHSHSISSKIRYLKHPDCAFSHSPSKTTRQDKSCSTSFLN